MPGDELFTPDTFYDLFGRLAKRGESLVVTQPYKGLLLSENFRILKVATDYLILQTHETRICAALTNDLRLHHKEFTFPILAKLLDRKIWMGQIWLHEFHSTGTPWRQRNGERVQPRDPTYITLTVNNAHRYTVYLDNLSESGLGTISWRYLGNEIPLRVGDEVTIDIRMVECEFEMVLKGIIATILPASKSIGRIGIKIFPISGQLAQLKGFIERRKSQIRDEIYSTLQRDMEPYRVETLYF